MNVHFGYDGAIAVVALVQDTRDAPAAGNAGPPGAVSRRWAGIPISGFRCALHHVDQSRIAQVTQAILHRIGFHFRCNFVDEGFVSKCILQPCRRAQRPRPERRHDIVRQNAFARHIARTAALSIDHPGNVRGHGVIVVREVRRIRRRCSGRECGRGKTRKESRNDVSGICHARTVAQCGRPRFVVPRDDRPLLIDSDTLVDRKGKPVVFPRHLVLARELDTHRPSDGLREKRGIIRDRIRAIASITARSHFEDDVNIFEL